MFFGIFAGMGRENVGMKIKKSNVKQWQIAEYLGMNEFSLSRKLRNEIAPEFEKQILIAIMQIKQERGH